MEHKVVTKKRKINWLLWIVPILTAIISISMVVKYYKREGLFVEVSFKDVNGIVPNQTPVKYKGVKIGVVDQIEIDSHNLNMFLVRLLIYPQYSYLIKQGSKFWKATVQISLDKISNLDTILKGSYIAMLPPASTREELEKLPTELYFVGLEHPPQERGIKIELISDNGDLGKGAGIFYKGFLVGKIYSKRLLSSGQVKYTGLIFQPYTFLLNGNIKFYKMSPIQFKASLQQLELKVGPLRTLLTGGIGIYRGEGNGSTTRTYVLYDNREDIQYAPQTIKLITRSRLPLSVVVYNDIIAGKVVDSQYNLRQDIRIVKIKLKKEFYHLLEYSPHFYIDRPELSLTNLNLKKLLTGPYIRLETGKKREPIKETYLLAPVPPDKMGYPLTFILENGSPPKKGAPILYHRFKVGEITGVKLVDGKFQINGKIYNRYRYLIGDSTLFYTIPPFQFKASWAGIKGEIGPLPSFLTGAVGFFTPYHSPLTRHTFPLLTSFNQVEERLKRRKGKVITITAPVELGVKVGTPIYYHTLKAGEVIARRFDPTSDRLQLTAYISPQFIHYLTPTTIFYRNSGVKVKVGLEGVEVKTAPLAAVVEGAISMEGNWTSTPSPATSYRLWSYDQFKNRNRFQVQLRMKTNPGLRTGTPLYLAGVKIGEVTKLEYDPQTEVVVASISVPKKYRKFFGRGAKIYLDQFQASIDGVRNVGAILTGGILHLLPSQTPPLKKYYRLTLINPPPTFTKPGIRVKLWTPGQRPISVGAPVYYKYVEVGKVEQVELNPDGGVVVTLFFPKKYRYLVRKGDRFSYLYPFKLTTHFLSLKLEVGTLPVILKGGIVLRDVNFSAPLAPAGTLFRLTPLPAD